MKQINKTEIKVMGKLTVGHIVGTMKGIKGEMSIVESNYKDEDGFNQYFAISEYDLNWLRTTKTARECDVQFLGERVFPSWGNC